MDSLRSHLLPISILMKNQKRIPIGSLFHGFNDFRAKLAKPLIMG